jgi:arabinogalactan endo-1,4-beta-galactosidase
MTGVNKLIPFYYFILSVIAISHKLQRHLQTYFNMTAYLSRVKRKNAVLCCALLCFLLMCPMVYGQKNVRNKILGADISWLPQFEEQGRLYYEHDKATDAIQILKDKGFNYIRLRIFNNPRADSGYSKKGYCDLGGTKKMALRIKAAGMGFLLDFHYSDNWADPGKQHIPSVWKGLSYEALQDSVRAFTKMVLMQLKEQGTPPDMVQVGNEINHGMMWPMANIKHLDTLAGVLRAGIAGVKDANRQAKIMLHIACGGQNKESRYFLDNMIYRKVKFDIIGESYYPEWHGTIAELTSNLNDLATRYKQDIIVVEYTKLKMEVNDAAFNISGKKITGTFIWEPLSYQEAVFDKTGHPNAFLDMYPVIKQKYGVK